MHRDKLAKLLIPIKEREFRDPKEIILTLGDNIKLLCDRLTQRTEH